MADTEIHIEAPPAAEWSRRRREALPPEINFDKAFARNDARGILDQTGRRVYPHTINPADRDYGIWTSDMIRPSHKPWNFK